MADKDFVSFVCPLAGTSRLPSADSTEAVVRSYPITNNINLPAGGHMLCIMNLYSNRSRVGLIYGRGADTQWALLSTLEVGYDMTAYERARATSGIVSVYADTISTTNVGLAGRLTAVSTTTVPVDPTMASIATIRISPKYAMVNNPLSRGVTIVPPPTYRDYEAKTNLSPDPRRLEGVTPVTFRAPAGATTLSLAGLWGQTGPNDQPIIGPAWVFLTVGGGTLSVRYNAGTSTKAVVVQAVANSEVFVAVPVGAVWTSIVWNTALVEPVDLMVTMCDPVVASRTEHKQLIYIENGNQQDMLVAFTGLVNYEAVPRPDTLPITELKRRVCPSFKPLDSYVALLREADSPVRVVYDRLSYYEDIQPIAGDVLDEMLIEAALKPGNSAVLPFLAPLVPAVITAIRKLRERRTGRKSRLRMVEEVADDVVGRSATRLAAPFAYVHDGRGYIGRVVLDESGEYTRHYGNLKFGANFVADDDVLRLIHEAVNIFPGYEYLRRGKHAIKFELDPEGPVLVTGTSWFGALAAACRGSDDLVVAGLVRNGGHPVISSCAGLSLKYAAWERCGSPGKAFAVLTSADMDTSGFIRFPLVYPNSLFTELDKPRSAAGSALVGPTRETKVVNDLVRDRPMMDDPRPFLRRVASPALPKSRRMARSMYAPVRTLFQLPDPHKSDQRGYSI